MRESSDETEIRQAYAAIQACVVLAGSHLQRCVDLLGRRQVSPPEPLNVSPATLKTLVEGLAELHAGVVKAVTLLKPVQDELPALTKEPRRSGSITESSWAEVAVEHAQRHAKDLEAWKRVSPSNDAELRRLIDLATDCMPNVPQLRADLRIEEAKARERARLRGSGGRFAYELDHLSGQSRKLFRFFVENEGRLMEIHEIGDRVMGSSRTTDGSVYTAVCKLRGRLESFGSVEVAKAIRTEEGGYRFR